MSKPFTDFEHDTNATTGVMWKQFITAIGIWVYCNEASGRMPTVAEAALAFNTTPKLVCDAVLEHPWLDYDDKLQIWSDGE